MSYTITPQTGEKSPWMKLMEWLYERGYGDIHREWRSELSGRQAHELPIDEWLRKNHPTIWNEYNGIF